MSVLVDSSIWIEAQNVSNPECFLLKRLILSEEKIFISNVIVTEVCQGAKTETDFEKFKIRFEGFDWLEEDKEAWLESAWHYFRARKKGLTLGTLDCLIGTLARRHCLQLWSKDKIFSHLQNMIGFELFVPKRMK